MMYEPCAPTTTDKGETMCSDHSFQDCNDTTIQYQGRGIQCTTFSTDSCVSRSTCTRYDPGVKVTITANMKYYSHGSYFPDVVAFDENGEKLKICRMDGLEVGRFLPDYHLPEDQRGPTPGKVLDAEHNAELMEYLSDGYYALKGNTLVNCVKDRGQKHGVGTRIVNTEMCFEGGIASEQVQMAIQMLRSSTPGVGIKKFLEVTATGRIAKIRMFAWMNTNGFPNEEALTFERSDGKKGAVQWSPRQAEDWKRFGGEGTNGQAWWFMDVKFD